MKYISSYLPFFMISLFLYGLFFYQHKQASIVVPLPINSGQQALQLEFIKTDNDPPASGEEDQAATKELASSTATTMPKIRPKTEPKTKSTIRLKAKPDSRAVTKQQEPAAVSDAELAMPRQAITAQTMLAPAQHPQTSEQAADAATANQTKINIANEKLHKSIQETRAIHDATLKGSLFDGDIKRSPVAVAAQKKFKHLELNAPQKTAKSKRVFKKQLAGERSKQIGSEKNQGVLQEAIVISGNKPVYPARAILRNKEGRVVVKLTVSMNGKSKHAQIITSSSHAILDDAVLDFVNKELFMPAHKGEEKITSEQLFSFRFELN